MKKTKYIQLVLVTAALASCHKPNSFEERQTKAFIRTDSTAAYEEVITCEHHHGSSPLLWYMAFRPYGWYGPGNMIYSPGMPGYAHMVGYNRMGYYSSAVSEGANIGHSSSKSGVVRGGFGRGGFSVSS